MIFFLRGIQGCQISLWYNISKRGKNYQMTIKIHKMHQMSVKDHKGHKIYQHLPLQDRLKFTQIGTLTIWQPWRDQQRKKNSSAPDQDLDFQSMMEF
jgi:hypothetical protein